jgi:hypothetical protein
MNKSGRLAPLIEFGALMERRGQVAVDVGGVLVPGPDFTVPFTSGKEEQQHERTEEAGPAAGPWSGPRRPQAEATPSAAAHPVRHVSTLQTNWQGNDINENEFDELEATYPDVRVVSSSSRCEYLGLTIRPFLSLPDAALLVLEVPRPEFATHARPSVRMHAHGRVVTVGQITLHPPDFYLSGAPPMVPPVRAWARWVGGPAHGALVVSHHRQPDFSICACMPYQWIRGVHPLVDYVGMCVTWFARALHERDLGTYPGLQHYPEWSRIERDRGDEFCGCGAVKTYAECHRRSDFALSAERLESSQAEVQSCYFADLRRQHRAAGPPARTWRDPFHSAVGHRSHHVIL